MSWDQDEPGLRDATHLLRRVVSRARRRPHWVLLLALFAAAVVILPRARRPASYQGRIVFRMDEGALTDPQVSARPPKAVRQYLARVALSNTRLAEIMERHDLSTTLRRIDMVAALESFREDLEIDVSRNYFLEDRAAGPPRWARVAIVYAAGDPETAAAVVRDLGNAIVEEQGDERARAAEAARAQARHARETMGNELGERNAELARRERALEDAGAAERGTVLVQIENSRSVARALELRIKDLDGRLMRLELADDLEQAGVGLQFVRLEEGTVITRKRPPPAQLAVEAALLFLLALPFALLFVGAFDRRVYHAEDLSRLGLELAAVFPAFPGERVRAMRERRNPRKQVLS